MPKGLEWVSLAACLLLGTVFTCVLFVRNWDEVSVVPVVKAQDSPAAVAKYVDIELDSPRYAARVAKVTVGKQVVRPGYYSGQGTYRGAVPGRRRLAEGTDIHDQEQKLENVRFYLLRHCSLRGSCVRSHER